MDVIFAPMTKRSIQEHDFTHLLPPQWTSYVSAWLQEDIPTFDIGGFVVGDDLKTATLFVKSPGVLCGVPFFDAVFREVKDCSVEWFREEGEFIACEKGRKVAIARVRGPARQILLGERTALNILARASGVATGAREAVDVAKRSGWHGMVAGTRKTTPGFRLVEKYALLVAGAASHRDNLSSMVMIKDNHVWAAGSITKAVKKAKVCAGFTTKIEVECSNEGEAIEACEAGAHIVMLDNFEPELLHEVARRVKEKHPAVIVEGSGGISLETMPKYLGPHVDVVSKSFHQGYSCVDYSLKIDRDEDGQAKSQ